jgi:uncharacterized protein YcfL
MKKYIIIFISFLLFISCSSEAKETEELNKNKVIVAL